MRQGRVKYTKKEFKIEDEVISIVLEVTRGVQVETFNWKYAWMNGVLTYVIPWHQSRLFDHTSPLEFAMYNSMDTNNAWDDGLNLEQMKELLIAQGYVATV